MKVIVPHHKPQPNATEEAKAMVERASGDLFGISGPVQIVDQKKSWRDSVMDFSFVAKYGFISVPITGTVTVDDQNVTIESELPKMVKQFIGEDKVRAGIEKKLSGLLT